MGRAFEAVPLDHQRQLRVGDVQQIPLERAPEHRKVIRVILELVVEQELLEPLPHLQPIAVVVVLGALGAVAALAALVALAAILAHPAPRQHPRAALVIALNQIHRVGHRSEETVRLDRRERRPLLPLRVVALEHVDVVHVLGAQTRELAPLRVVPYERTSGWS
eukprot:31275-Pelagococcus_subviridis.AAC.8